MRLQRFVVRLAFAVLATALGTGALAVLGCGGSGLNVGDTKVGREELYKTGNFDFDEYFEDVYGFQGSSKGATDEERAARAPLGQALGIGETSLDRMLDALKAKAEELAQSKNRVHLAMEGLDEQGKPAAGKTIAVVRAAAKGRAVPKDAEALAAALEQSAQKEAQVWEKYGPVPEKSRRIIERSDTLKGSVGKEFASASSEKREEIEHELEASKQIARDLGERSEKAAASAAKFLKQGGELLTAAASAEVKPPPKGSKGKPSKGDKAEKGGDKGDKPPPAKPKEGSPKPAHPPAPPEGSGDFNP